MTPARLVVVRHAMPQVRADADPATRVLSHDGLRAARELRVRLPAGARLVARDEPRRG